MIPTRWNASGNLLPALPDMFSIQREMNRMFDNGFRGGSADSDELMQANWSPSVDIAERDKEYLVNVELPGIDKNDVKITVQENILSIRGEKKQEKETKGANYHRVERSYGAFQRSFSLPTTVQSDRIEAAYKDGVLSITLPKAEEAAAKEIDVKVR